MPGTWKLFGEGRPYALSMLATDLLERFDLLLFMWLTSLIVQGYYSAMLPVAFPLTVIPNTLGIFLFNAGAREGEGTDQATRAADLWFDLFDSNRDDGRLLDAGRTSGAFGLR